MAATVNLYRAPYTSEILAEPDRVYDDCAASVGIMLFADWTLGEWLIQRDGDQWNVLALRNVVRRKIKDPDGGLTLHDVNDIGHELDPDLPDLPRYGGQAAKPNQSTAGATLRLNRNELKELLQNGHSAAVCGLAPNGVGHVIHVTDGKVQGVLAKDPLTRHTPGWKGERMSWDDLWRFTEAKGKDGTRSYGSPDAIACAVVKVGDETQEARTNRRLKAKVSELIHTKGDLAQTRLALTTTQADLKTAEDRIAILESATQPDLEAVKKAARQSFKDEVAAIPV
jgi:hypothetical protein